MRGWFENWWCTLLGLVFSRCEQLTPFATFLYRRWFSPLKEKVVFRLKQEHFFYFSGEHDRFKEEGTEQNIQAKKLFIHPDANETRLEDDLALIRLQHAVKFSPYVRTVCLPQPIDRLYARPGKIGVVAGWGSSQEERVGLDGLP